ncbi:MAG: HAMP domain-containing histidine kinase [Spirochaetales bacterium]|nr:HAMP domain-containing histidine kinase [Spirochaetales bacterium]
MKIFHSFYARLSVIFLLLITLLGAGFIVIAFYFSGYLFDEVEQVLNRGYAQSIATEIQPLVQEGFSREKIGNAIHYMMVLNPMVEIYLLDDEGAILAYFTHPGENIARDRIGLKPLDDFIASKGSSLILGEDPRSQDRQKPFSAAPLNMGSMKGYVYIILGGQGYDRSLNAIRTGYYARTALIAFSIIILVTLIAGFLLFFILTGRLRILNMAIQSFKQGKPFTPVQIKGNDELSTLGKTFNGMAASIAEGVEELKRAGEMRKELIANFSHDLRSPLASIRGYLETLILKDEQLSPDNRKEFLDIIMHNVSGFQNLVEELFELVMLENRQVQPNREMFNIRELVQDVAIKLKPSADTTRVSISIEAAGGIPMLNADIGMIERVLTNLIENALRYAPAGSTVTVGLAVEDGKTVISVRDTGPGIPAEELPHIFDRYFHGKRDKKRSSGKTGLGLAITRQMIELHGGALTVESTPGQGTCFFVRLPI